MNPVLAWVRLVRPPIVFICILGALVGALNAAHVGLLDGVLIALSAALMGAGLMVHNDVIDLRSDRVNRPDKPLCVGAINPMGASCVGLGLMLAAPMVALGVNTWAGILMALVMVIGVWYNTVGKLHGLWGHVAVAFGVGAIPLFGAWAVGEYYIMLPLAGALMVMEVGREIMVCVGDYHGDLQAGWRTTPVALGRRKAMLVALAFYVGSIPLFVLPWWEGTFGPLYGVVVVGFLATLLGTWAWCWALVRNVDDAPQAYKQPQFCGAATALLNGMFIWRRFELGIRTGTRVAVVALQLALLAEVFV